MTSIILTIGILLALGLCIPIFVILKMAYDENAKQKLIKNRQKNRKY